MNWGEASGWAQAAVGMIGVLVTITIFGLGRILGAIDATRKESNAGRSRLHERFDELPKAYVQRSEYQAHIVGLERTITGLSEAVRQLSIEVRELRAQAEKTHAAQLEHEINCPAREGRRWNDAVIMGGGR